MPRRKDTEEVEVARMGSSLTTGEHRQLNSPSKQSTGATLETTSQVVACLTSLLVFAIIKTTACKREARRTEATTTGAQWTQM